MRGKGGEEKETRDLKGESERKKGTEKEGL